ncbi:unnamed protein product [Mucor circinelloides]|uniref:Uncharacterized protein n=1 Tax=Mucor circinelloides f. circinelloides (strain 1006PhL) TaxID=1220926 RepID=S2JH28_MUCC1|nr:hypothetical protein HMPREF1544_11459 [Mucor circinelloides 1006PhL]
MRSCIITLLLTITLTISVSATSFYKRDISPAVQTCINSISSAGNQLAKISPSVDAFSSKDGYTGAYAIHQKEQLIEAGLKKANDDCCPLDRLSVEEIAAVLGVVTDLVPDVVKVLGTIVSKKLDFENLALATTLVKKDIKTVGALTTSLTTCLLNKGSITDRLVGTALKTQLDTAFAAVEGL